MGNLFNKVTAGNSPNLGEETDIQIQGVSKTPNRHDLKRISHDTFYLKSQNYRENKKPNRKAARENHHLLTKAPQNYTETP
jgi:hypothetical protein